MIRDVLASQAAKLVAACVCPAVGSAALTLAVPPVRDAIHKVTAPPARQARAKPRVRMAQRVARAPAKAGPEILCPTPTVLAGAEALPLALTPDAIAPMTSGAAAVRGSTALTPAIVPTNQPGAFSPGGASVFAGGPGLQPGTPDGTGPTDLPNEGGQLVPPPAPVAVVPEPAAWALLIAGFGLLGSALRLRRRRARVA